MTKRSGRSSAVTDRVWVYALTTPRPVLPRIEGVGGEPLRLVAAGSMAAVVGRPPRQPRSGPSVWLRYAAVVERLARRRAAVMPVRYGTRLGIDALRALLAARESSLRTVLSTLRFRVQMNVHVPTAADVEPAVSTGGAVGVPGGRVGRTRGTRYLRAKAAVAARESAVPGFDPVRAAVRRWVRDERIHRHEGRTTIFHLVPRAGADNYRRAIERAADAHGVHVTVTGPWAPYVFAEGLPL
jgi:hypothetical protein